MMRQTQVVGLWLAVLTGFCGVTFGSPELREIPLGVDIAQQRSLSIAGSIAADGGGYFALPDTNGMWQASTVDDGVAQLTVGPEGLFRQRSGLTFSAHGESDAGSGISLVARQRVRNRWVHTERENAFVAFTLDTTSFDNKNAVFNHIAVSLWRARADSPDMFQFAYDANGDGFGPEDFIGEPLQIAEYGADHAFSIETALEKPVWMQRDEVRLYAWFSDEENHGDGPVHLYQVNVAYRAYDGRLEGGTYQVYRDFDFGDERNHLTVIGSNPYGQGRVELRVGSLDSEPMGSVDVYHTGDWHHYIEFERPLRKAVRGVHDLYVTYLDPMEQGGALFCVRELRLERRSPGLRLPIDADDDGDGMDNLLEYATGQHPLVVDGVPVEISRQDDGTHEVAVRLRNHRSLDIRLRVSGDQQAWEEVPVRYVDGKWHVPAASSLRVVHTEQDSVYEDLYTVTFADQISRATLHVDVEASIGDGGRLQVYDPVPGLDPSPYYTFAVQKVSDLNADNLEDVTNWKHPFAFFTQVTPHIREEGMHWDRYYNQFIGSWSQTYCNFEMDGLTPIVVKISRVDDHPVAPSGPIARAAAHPERRVDAVEIINGDVYVTMSHPAQVVIDIDGQMDERDAPRVWDHGPNAPQHVRFPFRYESNAVHTVSIFANPVIEDKPDPDAPHVRYVEAGTPVPRDADGFWDTNDGKYDTLYFGPGVHKVNIDEEGNERGWRPGDIVRIRSDQHIYVPGDAILYFPLTDLRNQERVRNTRIFGHGTLSGQLMDHIRYEGIDYERNYNHLQLLLINQGVNCRFEGLTVIDPPMHGIYIYGASYDTKPNYMVWCKVIGWRQNSDAMGVTGNGYIKDSFLRGSDDPVYLNNRGLRRLVIWTDSFGRSLLGVVSRGQRGPNCPVAITKPYLIEDIDVIYGRNQGATRGIIDLGRCRGQATFATGTRNTGQHMVFRNINYEDPRPVKTLLYLRNKRDDNVGAHWAGVRFENVVQHHDHSPALRSARNPRSIIEGREDGVLRYNVFNQVYIAGEYVDQDYLDNVLDAEHIYDTIFK